MGKWIQKPVYNYWTQDQRVLTSLKTQENQSKEKPVQGMEISIYPLLPNLLGKEGVTTREKKTVVLPSTSTVVH